jgi:hypothetical protein
MANTVVEHVATGKRQVAWFDARTDALCGYAAKSPLTGAWLVGVVLNQQSADHSFRILSNVTDPMRFARSLVCDGNGKRHGRRTENASVMYDSDRPSHVLTTV